VLVYGLHLLCVPPFVAFLNGYCRRNKKSVSGPVPCLSCIYLIAKRRWWPPPDAHVRSPAPCFESLSWWHGRVVGKKFSAASLAFRRLVFLKHDFRSILPLKRFIWLWGKRLRERTHAITSICNLLLCRYWKGSHTHSCRHLISRNRGGGGVTLPHVRILNLQAVPLNFGHPSHPRGYLFSKQALSTLEQLLVENNIGETTGHIEFRASHVAGYWLTLIFDGTPIVSGSSVDVGKTWWAKCSCWSFAFDRA